MPIETYCDLCDKKKECIKKEDGLWACILCMMKFYKAILNKPLINP